MSIKAGLQQQLKDKHQQYTGRVTIVDSHQYQFVTNDQPCFCDAIAYPSVVDKKTRLPWTWLGQRLRRLRVINLIGNIYLFSCLV